MFGITQKQSAAIASAKPKAQQNQAKQVPEKKPQAPKMTQDELLLNVLKARAAQQQQQPQKVHLGMGDRSFWNSPNTYRNMSNPGWWANPQTYRGHGR
ncbi:MAG TPA: hypothetical protein V6D00_02360 [Pantanalinema sp.]